MQHNTRTEPIHPAFHNPGCRKVVQGVAVIGNGTVDFQLCVLRTGNPCDFVGLGLKIGNALKGKAQAAYDPDRLGRCAERAC